MNTDMETLITQNEADLIQRAQKGDHEAISQLFTRLHQPLLNFLYHMLGNRHEAEDIGQDAFIRAFDQIAKIGPPWDFKSWLFRIASNLAIDYLRREKRYMSEEEVELNSSAQSFRSIEGTIEQTEKRQAIWETLEAIPTNYRQALILKEFNRFSYDEIAANLECSMESARQLIHRARLKFKEKYWLAMTLEIRPPKCQVLNQIVTSFTSTKPNHQERSIAESHILSCPICMETRDSFERASSLLAGLPLITATPVWKTRVIEQILKPFTSMPAGNSQELAQPPHESPLQPGTRPQTSPIRSSSMPKNIRNLSKGRSSLLSKLSREWLWLIPVVGAPLLVISMAVLGLLVYGFYNYLTRPPTPTLFSSAHTVSIFDLGTLEVQSTFSPTFEPSQTSQALSTTTPSIVPSVTYSVPMIRVSQDAHCRLGPGTKYPVLTSLTKDMEYPIDGHNQDSTWWRIRYNSRQDHCWVWNDLVQVLGNVDDVPFAASPQLSEPSEIPSSACWVFNPQLKKDECIAPCPVNAKPGGVCVP